MTEDNRITQIRAVLANRGRDAAHGPYELLARIETILATVPISDPHPEFEPRVLPVLTIEDWQATVDPDHQYDSKGRCANCREPGHGSDGCLKAHDRARAARETP